MLGSIVMPDFPDVLFAGRRPLKAGGVADHAGPEKTESGRPDPGGVPETLFAGCPSVDPASPSGWTVLKNFVGNFGGAVSIRVDVAVWFAGDRCLNGSTAVHTAWLFRLVD